MPHDTWCQGRDIFDVRFGECRQYPTSLCELERRGVRRPLKRMGRVVLFAAPLLACAVPQLRWTNLRRIARQRRYHCNHRAHIAGGCQTAVFDTCVSYSKRVCRVCGQLNVCMICGWVLAFCLPLVA